jgi:hypothetical protein
VFLKPTFDETYDSDFPDSDIDFEKHLGIVDELLVQGLYQRSPFEHCQEEEVWPPMEPGGSSMGQGSTTSIQKTAISPPLWIGNYLPCENSETIFNDQFRDDQIWIRSNHERAGFKPIKLSRTQTGSPKPKLPAFVPPMVIKSYGGLHIRRKTSANLEPRHSCPRCDKYNGEKAFRRKDHLLQHLRTLHCGGPFECSLQGCNRKGERGYSVRANLINHQRRKHPQMHPK